MDPTTEPNNASPRTVKRENAFDEGEIVSIMCIEFLINKIIYDKEAPTRVGATQTPSLVLILWTLFVAGLIHAASLLSSVMKPGWMASKIFFLGFSWGRGVASCDKMNKECS